MAIDKETAERIEQPVAAEAEREVQLTPAEAIERMRINVPVRGNRKLRTLVERVNADDQLKGWWHVSNINAVSRMAINDHSWVHVQIVTNIALKLLRQLTKHGVEPGLVRDFGLEQDDAEIVVVLAALFHCVGMSIHRHGHEDFSLFLAEPKMRELLDGVYDEPDRTVITSEVLQAITSHRDYGKPLTIEAGIVRVADALDQRAQLAVAAHRHVDAHLLDGLRRCEARLALSLLRDRLLDALLRLPVERHRSGAYAAGVCVSPRAARPAPSSRAAARRRSARR